MDHTKASLLQVLDTWHLTEEVCLVHCYYLLYFCWCSSSATPFLSRKKHMALLLKGLQSGDNWQYQGAAGNLNASSKLGYGSLQTNTQ